MEVHCRPVLQTRLAVYYMSDQQSTGRLVVSSMADWWLSKHRHHGLLLEEDFDVNG